MPGDRQATANPVTGNRIWEEDEGHNDGFNGSRD
jgi:hypothetical protein